MKPHRKRRLPVSTWLAGAIGGALLAGYALYRQYRPTIRRISRAAPPAWDPESECAECPGPREVTIMGHGFGTSQASALVIQVQGKTIPSPEIVTWTDDKIAARFSAPQGNGRVQVVRQLPFLPGEWASNVAPFVVQADGLPTEPYGYAVPVQADAPWPTFRHDRRNTGHSPLPAQYRGDHPWSFQTGKGIFSTPIIDRAGTVYVGSADHNFYALNPDGTAKWHFQTDEIIDSAGALPRANPSVADGAQTVIFPSGDSYMRCLRVDDGAPVWSLDARVSPRASYNNWWEGNVAIGYDGAIYAGNTNFNYYAINPDGSLRWTYPTGSNAWSHAAFAEDGTIFWGSLDTKIHAVRPDGSTRWTKRTLGFVSASAALGSDGTVYIGSFDSYFYALEPETGRVKWKFKTGDHIYGSAALGADAAGQTNAIYFGSTDGIFYALTPDGACRWQYDTGAPIRSSPALGRAPEGETGKIVYFGSGNGKLYALNAADGTRRWSYDTTPEDAERRDRNDLNGSPALGHSGVYIGGEHGQVWYVPYDYPLHVPDARGQTDPGDELPADLVGLRYVTPGGNLAAQFPETLPVATLITLCLIVRQDGETVDAWTYNAPVGRPADALQIRTEPACPLHVEQSADGRYLHLIPDGFLTPGQAYTLHVAGNYYSDGLDIGNLTLGGRKRGRFQEAFTFRVQESPPEPLPLAVGEKQVTAFEWTRLAVPIPPMLPSLNQIGFDYMDWIVGTVALTPPDTHKGGKVILWAIGGRRDADGTLMADPASDFTLPLNGLYRDDAFILTNQRFMMAITGIPIPFNTFQLRGRMGTDLKVKPGATAYSDAQVRTIPTFGPYMVIAGLANNWWEKLLTVGTYVTRPYDAQGDANRRPDGIRVDALTYRAPSGRQDGQVVAQFSLAPGAAYPLTAHRPGILLVDAARTEAVTLDYHANLSSIADAEGNLAQVTLNVPAGTALPPALKAIVLLDVFPFYEQALTG